jgi:hypothetical protein
LFADHLGRSELELLADKLELALQAPELNLIG